VPLFFFGATTSSSEIRPTARLERAASGFRVRWWRQLVPLKISGLSTHLNRGPNRSRHSYLTNTLLGMTLYRGSSCYEHIVPLAVSQRLWSRHQLSYFVFGPEVAHFDWNFLFFSALWGQYVGWARQYATTATFHILSHIVLRQAAWLTDTAAQHTKGVDK
jgi:hypothetical protein